MDKWVILPVRPPHSAPFKLA